MQMTALFEVPVFRWQEFIAACSAIQIADHETAEDAEQAVQIELMRLRDEGFAVPHATAFIYRFKIGSFGTLLWHDGPRDEDYSANNCDLYIGTSYALEFDPPIPVDWYACKNNRTIYGVYLGHKRLEAFIDATLIGLEHIQHINEFPIEYSDLITAVIIASRKLGN